MTEPRAVARLLPWLPGALFLVVLAFAAARHPFGTYGTETDFYHLYAPDAARLAEGRAPANTFQGPGYPLVLALVAKVTGDLFVAGKWISVLSGALTVVLAAHILGRLFGSLPGLCGALLFAASPQFARYAIQATTDVFFLMLSLAIVAAVLPQLAADEQTPRRGTAAALAIVAGALSALAYLTRYNAVSLLGVVVVALVARRRDRKWRDVALYAGTLVVCVAPWLLVNAREHGSPLYNTNYLNVATAAYPELTGGRADQDATRVLAARFHSFGDVLFHDPARFAESYRENLVGSFLRSSVALLKPWVAFLAIAGLVLALMLRRSAALSLVLAAAAAHMLLMGLSHWETRYYFFPGLVFAALAAWAPFGAVETFRTRGLLRGRGATVAAALLVGAMCIQSGNISAREMQRFLSSHPLEVIDACEALQRAGVKGARIAARKPHLAAICEQQWVFLPQVRSAAELGAWARANGVDFVAIGTPEMATRRALVPLLDPRNAPPSLRAVWGTPDGRFVLYRVAP